MIIRSTALALPLRDACVDLIVTSPPYFALRSYRDGDEHYDGQLGSEETPAAFVDALIEATKEMVRVLKPTGSIFVNLGDKYAGSGGHNNAGISRASQFPLPIGADGPPQGEKRRRTAYEAEEIGDKYAGAARRNAPDRYNQNSDGIRPKSLMGLPWRYANAAVDRLGLILRRDLIWHKPNGLPESVTDRCRSSHEYWFHFVKQGRYFSAIDELREAQLSAGRPQGSSNGSRWVENLGQGRVGTNEWKLALNPLGKLPGSVWTIPSEPLIVPDWARDKYNLPDHFAAFPQEWPRRLILGWSPSGICTKCGEGRRPVATETGRIVSSRQGATARPGPVSDYGGRPGENAHKVRDEAGTSFRKREAVITGYACACDVPIAPTRPAIVLDPFGGTGTVAMVARALGRTGLNGELSGDYGRLARWRIYESGHAAKSEERTWRDAQQAML